MIRICAIQVSKFHSKLIHLDVFDCLLGIETGVEPGFVNIFLLSVYVTDLDKLKLVKLGYSGLILSLMIPISVDYTIV